MSTVVVPVDPEHPNPDEIARAASLLRGGGLVAFPTETVYGLGADALNQSAVRRLFEVKGRPANDPVIVHIASLEQIALVVMRVPAGAETLADRFWPGPLTLIMPRGPAVPHEITAGLETVAVRVPSHPVAQALLKATQAPVAAPSANLFSRPSPTRAAHVLQDLGGRIDLVLDAGATQVGVESTVLDLTGDVPRVLRPGAVTLEQLRTVLPDVRGVTDPAPHVAADSPMASPGLLPKHYAPRTPLRLYTGNPQSLSAALVAGAQDELSRGARIGVLATAEDSESFRGLPVKVAELGPAADLAAVAARLYAALRELDEQGLDLILARAVEVEEGLGRAVQDRLRRAASEIVRVP